jgi:cytochrome b6-f complex iron-sulfur subunit
VTRNPVLDRNVGRPFVVHGQPAFVASLNLAAAANASLRSVGGQRIIGIGGKRYLVIRTAAATFVALSATCSHAGCMVSFAMTSGDVVCSCHGLTFALDGAVTKGPATMPLTRYETTFNEASEILTVVLA